MFGPFNGSTYQAVTTDDIGIDSTAIANVASSSRGVSGITATAIQYGIGIADNEFYAGNPAGASAQSMSMAGVQAMVDPKFASSSPSHFYWGLHVSNLGKQATAAIGVDSAGTAGDLGAFEHMLYAGGAKVSSSALFMPQSLTGDAGTTIVYDTAGGTDFTRYIRSTDTYQWLVNSATVAQLNGTGLGVGSNLAPINKLDVSGAVAIGSYAGVNSAPTNGLIVSGNTGIGTTSPWANLVAEGAVRKASHETGTLRLWLPRQCGHTEFKNASGDGGV